LAAQSHIEIPVRGGGKNRLGSAFVLHRRGWLFADGGKQLTVRHDVAMNRRDPVHVDIQAPHVGRQVNRRESGNFGGSAPAGLGLKTSSLVNIEIAF